MDVDNPGNELGTQPQFCAAMDVETSSAQKSLQATCGENDVDLGERLHEMIAKDSVDFGSWTFLISEIEKVHDDNIDMLTLAYESFLSKFLLCHWYWTKYAYHKARLCTVVEAVDIFERAVESTTFSVGFWLNYCTFGESFFMDPSDIRRVYERALSFVGKDYNCHVLWDNYLQFEFSQQQWGMLAYIYIRVLKFPTKGLYFYYDNFQKFVTVMEEERKGEDDSNILVDPDDIPIIELMKSKDEIPCIIKDLQDLSDSSRRFRALQKYKTIGNQFYQKALELDKEIKIYEAKIETNYFQERLIDDDKIGNWHQYLDFIEKQEDFDWALKLYERCLISCAKYPEFWIRYVEFLEKRRGRPLAIFALDRATEVFLKDVPEIHIFSARFKERIGNIKGARDAYHFLTGSDEFVEYVVRQANMEKRIGNLEAASEIYEKALKTAVEQQKVHFLPNLYTHFYRLKYMVTGSVDAALDVIINGIQQVPRCRILLEELINFAMLHDGARCINVIESIVSKAIYSAADAPYGFDMKDKVDISCLYLEFVDLCGSINDIEKAWSRHNKLFPQVLRPDSLSKQPAVRRKSTLIEMKERKESNPVQVWQPSPLINHSTKINQVSEDLSLQGGVGINSPEKRLCSSPEVTPQTTGHVTELDGLNHYRVLNKQTDDSSETKHLAHGMGGPDVEAKSASMETNLVIQQHIENSSIPPESTNECVLSETFSESLQHVSVSVDNHQDRDNEVGHGPKMDSLENVSLDSEENKSLELSNRSLIDEIPAAKVVIALEEQVPEDPATIKPSSTSDCLNTPHPHSAAWKHGSYVSKPDDPLSSANRENHILEHDHPNSSRSPSPGGNSHLVSQSVEREKCTAGNHDNSHAQQQQSETIRSQQHLSAAMDQELPRDRGSSEGSHEQGLHHPGLAEGNAENSHAWTVNNVSQQRAVSSSQSQLHSPPGNHPQSIILNQMLPHHYQRQQIMQQYEQQMLPTHQQYIHHQHQQQEQLQTQTSTPLLQQQQFVQQQQLHSLPYELQQLHQQQSLYWQHVQQQPSQISSQQYHQANGLGQQFYPSGSQQQADQGYQLLWQQYQLQQQGYYYMMQQNHHRHQQQQQMMLQQQQQQQQEEEEEGSNNQMQLEEENQHPS